MFSIKKKGDHGLKIPNFSRSVETKEYPFNALAVGDFLEIYVDHDKDWELEVMYEHDVVFALNSDANDGEKFRHQPLLVERLIRIWRVK